MAQLLPTPPKPPSVIARKRNGAPRRIDIAAQTLNDTLALLQSVPSPEARRLSKELADVLRPICYWSSPRRDRWGSGRPAWGMCGRKVSAPGERCVEHTWPLPEGVADPFPDRCVTVLDDYRWVDNSAGLRCPYGSREGSDRCPHHDPREDDLCGYRDGDAEPCTVPEVAFPCLSHRETKQAVYEAQLQELLLSTPCRQCKAPPGQGCVSRSGNPVGLHRTRTKDGTGTSDAKVLTAVIEWHSNGPRS